MPVVGVRYFVNPLASSDTTGQILRAWPSVREARSGLVLLNGVWSKAPELHRQILDLAGRAHVIVADQTILPPKPPVPYLPPPAHLVTVSPARECPEWLRVEIQFP